MAKDTIYTDSEVTINGVTYRNLPAQVRRNQALSEQASSDASAAAGGITEAKEAAAEAKDLATTANNTANSAIAGANQATTTANGAVTAANEARTKAETAQETAENALGSAVNAEQLAGNAVRYDSAQMLSDAEKLQARSNIGVTEQGVTIDDELSSTSENPLQNKVINSNFTSVNNILVEQASTINQMQGTIGEASYIAQRCVRYDISQSIDSTQKKQARDNILAKLNSNGQIVATNITALSTEYTYTVDTTMYKNLYVEVLPKSDSANIGCTIPIFALQTTDKRYQLTDEVNYVSFKLRISAFDSRTATLTCSMATRAQATAKIVQIIAVP